MQDNLRFQLCPPFFKLQGLRFDTPTNNHFLTYGYDCKFFAAHKGRRLRLRDAIYNEFDVEFDSMADWLKVPKLHVLVTQHSVGVHMVTPVYRGKSFYPESSTDAEVNMILATMFARRGIDQPEFEAFEQAHNEANRLLRAASTEVLN